VSFTGVTLTSKAQATALLANPALNIHHGKLLTCVWREATAACRQDGQDQPDWGRCTLSCANITWTDRDIASVRARILALTASLTGEVLPGPLRQRTEQRITRLSAIVAAHEATRAASTAETGRRMNHYDRLARLDQERQHVQDAARRLLSGTARASSGSPTVASLARESGINRTSLYQRHPGLIAEFKANAPDAAVTPAAQALQGQLDAARTRIASLEQENAALRERVRTLTALVVEMNLEADGKTNVIPLKR